MTNGMVLDTKQNTHVYNWKVQVVWYEDGRSGKRNLCNEFDLLVALFSTETNAAELP